MTFLLCMHFTFIANIIYIPVEATFNMSVVCPNHYGQYFNENGTLLCLLCPDSDPS